MTVDYVRVLAALDLEVALHEFERVREIAENYLHGHSDGRAQLIGAARDFDVACRLVRSVVDDLRSAAHHELRPPLSQGICGCNLTKPHQVGAVEYCHWWKP